MHFATFAPRERGGAHLVFVILSLLVIFARASAPYAAHYHITPSEFVSITNYERARTHALAVRAFSIFDVARGPPRAL